MLKYYVITTPPTGAAKEMGVRTARPSAMKEG